MTRGEPGRGAPEEVREDAVPDAAARAPGARVAIARPRRSRLSRWLGDFDLEWRARACTALLLAGWADVRVEHDGDEERAVARRPADAGG